METTTTAEPRPAAPPQVVIQQSRTSGMALASLILGILGFFGLGGLVIPSILGVIFGHIGLRNCRRDPALNGRGMAIAGLIMGYLVLLILLVSVLLFAGALGYIYSQA